MDVIINSRGVDFYSEVRMILPVFVKVDVNFPHKAPNVVTQKLGYARLNSFNGCSHLRDQFFPCKIPTYL